jgi:hypothetical protein
MVENNTDSIGLVHCYKAQGGHTMRAHQKNSDTAKTSSTCILNKNESCKTIRIDLNFILLQKRSPYF